MKKCINTNDKYSNLLQHGAYPNLYHLPVECSGMLSHSLLSATTTKNCVRFKGIKTICSGKNLLIQIKYVLQKG